MRQAFMNSLFLRLAGMMVAATLAVTSFLAWQSNALVDRLASHSVVATARQTVALKADALIKPVRFKADAKIAEIVEEAMASAGSAGLYAAAFDLDGALLHSAGALPDAVSARIDDLVQGTLASGEPSVSADGMVHVHPLLPAVGAEPAGVFAMVWSDSQVIAANLPGKLSIMGQSAMVLVAVGLLLTFGLRKFLDIPLRQLAAAVHRVADGDYDSVIAVQDRGDELGRIATNLAELANRLSVASAEEQAREADHQAQLRVVEALGAGLDALSRGVLSQTIDGSFPDRYEPLRDDFNRAILSVGDAIRSVGLSAEAIRGGVDEIAASSDDLSKRTETQAATLEQTAAALDQLSSSVRVAAENAGDADAAVGRTRDSAARNEEVMRSAVEAMSRIEESAEQIGEIISVIDDIAFQTNLLALNAGVEAARAGDSGKGFAVVASEVRALAQRSSDAARQIKDLISGSTEQVKTGAELVDKAGVALEEMVRQVTSVSELVSGIAQAASEQAQGLGEISSGVASLDQVTQQNAAMVEEATAAAHLLRSETRNLVQNMARFNLDGASETDSSVVTRPTAA